MFRSVRFLVVLGLTTLVVTPWTMHAQETLTNASVTGRVLDPSGSVMPHIAVKALASATNQTYMVETDNQGRFRLPYLPVGEYRISALANGFAESTRVVQLTVGSAFDLKLQLSIASASSNIQVTAEPPVLEENRSQISQTVLQPEVTNPSL